MRTVMKISDCAGPVELVATITYLVRGIGTWGLPLIVPLL